MPLRARFSLITLVAATGLFSVAGLQAASAADNVAVFAGGQVDFSNYVFAGVTIALPGSTVGNGAEVRILGDTGGYSYVNNTLGTVNATFTGGEFDGVYAFTHKNVWADFGAGVNYTYTGLTPNDPGNRLEGDQTELRLLTDGGTTSGPWRFDWDGYYGTRLQDYEALIDGSHSLSPFWRLGVEGYGEGNPTYSLERVGPFAGVSTGPNGEVRFSTGVSWESGFATPRAYFTALYYQRF